MWRSWGRKPMPLVKLLPLERSAWTPITVEGDGPLVASKFSGRPWLAADETWPTCTNCGEPMQFFLQLNLDHFPGSLQGKHGSGLLQLFYCINKESSCEMYCDAFFPFAKSELVRLVQPQNDGTVAEASLDIASQFPPRRIIRWKEVKDYPHPEEATEFDVTLTDAEWDELDEAELPQRGDKLAGWPAWVQGVEYPECPKCKGRMRLVFQIDSNDNLPYDFGDVGTGHITQCEEHKDVLAFGWACS